MKKFAFIIVAVLIVLALTACGGEEAAPTSSVGSYSDSDETFLAEVESDVITIHIVGDDDSKSLYWTGTWTNGEEKVVSKADKEQLDASLLGSQSDTKEFTVSGKNIEFEFQAMGSSKNVKLEKN